MDTDEDEDVELFQAAGNNERSKRDREKAEKEAADDLIYDIVQRRDQRR